MAQESHMLSRASVALATSTETSQTRSSLSNKIQVHTVRARIWTEELLQLGISELTVRLQESLSTIGPSKAETTMTPTRKRSFEEMTMSLTLLKCIEGTAQTH